MLLFLKIRQRLIDFEIFIELFDLSKYDYLHLHLHDDWSVLIHKDAILINKEYVTPQDLINRHLICYQQSI